MSSRDKPGRLPHEGHPRVFISYRRSDSSPYARSIHDELSKHFGTENVFLDRDSIEPGHDFVASLTSTLEQADVVLVVIGPNWLASASGAVHRLDDSHDYVRMEVEAAIARADVRVIPVLVGGARMPDASVLPESLAPLARRNACALDDEHYAATMAELGRSLDPEWDESPTRPGRSKWALFAVAAVAVIAIAIGGFVLLKGSDDSNGSGAGSGASTEATMTAKPLRLDPGASTSIRGSNFPPGLHYLLAQCWVSDDQQTKHCDTSSPVHVTVGRDGTFANDFPVRRTVTGADDGQRYNCATDDELAICAVAVVNGKSSFVGPAVFVSVDAHSGGIGEGTIP